MLRMLVAGLLLSSAVMAQRLPSDQLGEQKLRQYAGLALDWERQYLRINTSNPPGNEIAAARWFKQVFDAEGIPSQVFEFRPGRANIIAWVRAGSAATERPLILLNHMDVVTSDPARWKTPPFSAEIIGGSVYGRGAQDMKSIGVAQLLVMVMLKREGVALNRDVIFLGTADEEVDDAGSDWMIANHPELLRNAEYLLTEGGETLAQGDAVQYVGIDTAEKSPFWIHIAAAGRPGHGSRPLPDSAPNELVRALGKLVAYRTELKILPVTEAFLAAMAPLEQGERARCFRDPRAAIHDNRCAQMIGADESLNYMFRNTVSLTMLKGSEQTNVIPGEAWANVDVRLLPGEEPQDFLALIRKVVSEPGVSVEAQQKKFRRANASRLDTPLFSAIKDVSAHYFGNAPVVPRLSSGYTENQMYRELGITCYGFNPYTATPEEGATHHGDNERIRVSEVQRGFRVLYDVVMEVSAGK
ncbi:MAG: M20/M25/M40 family metallo-hydrolase [Acidobacteria bacterium]|nr:M20/M25/M40 family metallo-hydrolase [Acidobacteriota bacterium]